MDKSHRLCRGSFADTASITKRAHSVQKRHRDIAYINPSTPRTPNFHKTEILRLNQHIESFEISKSVEKSTNPPEDYQNYKKYLEDLAISLKSKDLESGNCLIKVTLGLTKAVEHWVANLNESRAKTEKTKKAIIVKKNRSCQTTTEEYKEEPSSDFNLETIKMIQGRIKGFKYGGITRHLGEVLDSLTKMYMEVPQESELPELTDINFADLLRNEDDSPQKSISGAKIFETKNPIFQIHRFVQTEEIDDSHTDTPKAYLIEMLKERELNYFKIKQQLEVAVKDKKRSDDLYLKFKNEANSYQKKYEELTESKPNHLQTNNPETAELVQKLKKKKEKAQVYKTILAENKIRNFKKVPLLQEIEDKHFQNQVESFIKTEKLLQIEKVWNQENDKTFDFSHINRESVIKKYSIAKKNYFEEFKDETPTQEDYDRVGEISAAKNANKIPFYRAQTINFKRGAVFNSLISKNINKKNYDSKAEVLLEEVSEYEPNEDDARKLPRAKKADKVEDLDENIDQKIELPRVEQISSLSNSHTPLNHSKGSPKIQKLSPSSQHKTQSKSFETDSSRNHQKEEQLIKPQKHISIVKKRNILDYAPKNAENLSTQATSVIQEETTHKKPLLKYTPNKTSKKEMPDSLRNKTLRKNEEPLKIEMKKAGKKIDLTHQESEVNELELAQPLMRIDISTPKSLESDTELISRLKMIEQRLEENEEELRTSSEDLIFSIYTQIKEDFYRRLLYQARINCAQNSKAIQTLAQPLHSITRSWAKQEGDVYTHGSNKTVIHQPVLIDDTPQAVHNIPEEPSLLIKLFKNEEIDQMPLNCRFELLNAMRGHIDSKCGENCIHLQRAMNIRHRSRGIPYPLHYKDIQLKQP